MTLTENVTLVTESCCNCGVLFAMTADFRDEKLCRAEETRFYCPNGHSQYYTGESDKKKIARLTAEKIAVQARLETARSERDAAERARDRARAEKKRIETRIAKAVCPYCNRSFADDKMARHIHTKHPEKAHEA